MKQTCNRCRWYLRSRGTLVLDNDGLVKEIKYEHSCHHNSRFEKWLDKDSANKPNNCENFEV